MHVTIPSSEDNGWAEGSRFLESMACPAITRASCSEHVAAAHHRRISLEMHMQASNSCDRQGTLSHRRKGEHTLPAQEMEHIHARSP